MGTTKPVATPNASSGVMSDRHGASRKSQEKFPGKTGTFTKIEGSPVSRRNYAIGIRPSSFC
jgi:hypothetical protein